ncbi:APC family permease [Acidithiobacillus sp. IBUN Pt1247-S3]|uniref:APC family permease n=1 Tax=Acidithiobacillus sp. IBUN Pt1247-S3 TaxID=3166642 RepID=UPI0034E5D95D
MSEASASALQKDVVGFWGLVGQSISGMAPTCDVVAFMTAGAAFALVAMPLSYLAAFILMFIEVNTIYHLTKHRASAGGYYSFVSAGLGAPAAMVTGFMVIFYQTLSVGAIPVYVGGVFLPGLARGLGIDLPSWFWIASILFFIGVPWLLSVAGIRPSIRTVAITSLLEIAFLVGSSLFIISRALPTHPLEPFSFTDVGFKGVAMGMIFAITSFIGIGSHTPLGEEARGVRTQNGRVIGKAALVSLSLVGAALILSAYALTVGWGMHDMHAFSENGAPGVVVFQRYLGFWGAVALVILAINSAMADGLALLNGSARVLFAIARDRLLHTRFALVNGQRAPQGAINFLAALALGLAILFGLVFGPSNGFNVMTTAVLIGLVTAHTLMNLALMRLHTGSDSRVGLIFFHYFLPVVATLLFWWVLWESLFPLAYPLGWSLALWLLALVPALGYAIFRSRRLSHSQAHELGTGAP